MSLSPYTFVTQRIAIGGLAAYGQPLHSFGLRLNVAEELVEPLRHRTDILHAKLDDQNDMRVCLAQAPRVMGAVRLLKQAWSASGYPLLVTCAQGRNRSALVVAEFLIRQKHQSPETIIRSIQSQRKGALTNPAFVKWLCRKR